MIYLSGIICSRYACKVDIVYITNTYKVAVVTYLDIKVSYREIQVSIF